MPESLTFSGTADKLGEELSAAKFIDTGASARRTMRKEATRKDGEEEFFNMTYLSNLLPHPQKNKLIEL